MTLCGINTVVVALIEKLKLNCRLYASEGVAEGKLICKKILKSAEKGFIHNPFNRKFR